MTIETAWEHVRPTLTRSLARPRFFGSAGCLCALLLLGGGAAISVKGNGPLAGFNVSSPYLIYYGGWTSAQVDFARRNYRLVILDAHNVSASQVAALRAGPDNILGTADDVLVLGYLSLGEDTRPGGPFIGDREGPRVDPRNSDSEPLASITNGLGLPSPGGTNYASYYLDTKASPDGLPDRNPTYGGYYINAGAPAWWPILKGMTIAADGNAGLDELVTTNVGKGLGCDGVFLDTLDTCAPNSWGGTTYEWTAPGMQGLIQRISTNYPARILMGNRGLFFFNPNYKQYAYTIRPYVNMVMFESYFNDSDNSTQITPSFPDNKYDWAPKLNAEAGRPDGFNVVSLDYDHSPPLPQSIINQSYQESMGIQGWTHYRTDPTLTSAFNTNASAWLATNADTLPPVWDSTAAQSSSAPAPRVGIQEAAVDDGSVTARWDVARDQTRPVWYNVYYAACTNALTTPGLDFASATRLPHVTPALPAAYTNGTGPGIYAYEYTINGLSNGVPYFVAVRAEDSASPSHEDTNSVTLLAVPGTNGAASNFRKITIDGDFSDWVGLPWAYQAAPDGNPVNFIKVQFANDDNYLYGHFVLASNAVPFSDINTHLFVDSDNNAQTGFQASSAAFGSEWMIEGSAGYDERNGGFNEGVISGLGWALAPASGMEFEFRVSLSATFSDGTAVVGTNTLRLLLQDNRGSEVATGNGLTYRVAPGGPYEDWRTLYFTPAELADPAISGDGADASGDGIPNLVKYAFDLNPLVVNHPSLPAGFIESSARTNYFDIQFVERNPPAGVLYLPQLSTNLIAWDGNPTNFVAVGSVASTNNTSVVTLRLLPPISTTQYEFVRIAIQKQ